jgi:glycosyltransferase involved in cell wall biosynthesis
MQVVSPGSAVSAAVPAMPAHRHRILLDCTETVRLRANTGIQRVVRSIADVGAKLDADTFEIRPVVFDGSHFVHFDGPRLPEPMMSGTERGARPGAGRRLVTSGSHSAVLRASILHPAVLGVARQAVAVFDWSLRRRMSALGTSQRRVEYLATDWVVLLDSTWDPDQRPELLRAKASGARVCMVIYDLIKIRSPELASPGAGAIFRRWFLRTAPLADRIVAISRTVRDDVQRYLAEVQRPDIVPGKVAWFHLGSDFDRVNRDGEVSPQVQALVGAGHPHTFLVVGTIEPRKAQTVVLDTFEHRWDAGDPARLVMLGRQGWGSHALVRRLRTHPELGRRLFWLERANDADLGSILRRSTALIIASTSEGFGLPIVEALRCGVPVIASDIPIFREVGGSQVTYFPPGDRDALGDAIDRGERNELKRPDPGAVHAYTWMDSTRELVALLLEGDQ